jgi:hypothetical protein
VRWLIVGGLALACVPLVGRPSPQPSPEPCECPAADPILTEVLIELGECQTEVRECAAARVETREVVRTRTVQAPPRRCGPAPEILPITTVECAPGMRCLDETAYRRLGVNEAAYRRYIRDCEGE